MNKIPIMKTKIVYVLISSENDLYLEQAWLSLYSLRLHNPTTHVSVLVDESTQSSLVGKREGFKKLPTEIIVIDTPKDYTPVQRSRYIKTTARKYISGDFLFIDTDTIITDRLDELDSLEIEITSPINEALPTYTISNIEKDTVSFTFTTGPLIE